MHPRRHRYGRCCPRPPDSSSLPPSGRSSLRRRQTPLGFPSTTNPRSPRLRSVQIYQVEPPSPEVRTYPVSDPVIVSGSPSSLLVLLEERVLDGRAVLLAGDIGSQAAAAHPTPHGPTPTATNATTLDSGPSPTASPTCWAPTSAARSPSPPSHRASPWSRALHTRRSPSRLVRPAFQRRRSLPRCSRSTPRRARRPPSTTIARPRGWLAPRTTRSASGSRSSSGAPCDTAHHHRAPPGRRGPKAEGDAESRSRPPAASVQQTIHDGANTLAVRPGPSTWLKVTLTTVQRARSSRSACSRWERD